MKHAAKRPSEAKQQIIGQMPVDAGHSDIMSNGLGKTATRSKAGCMTCRIRCVTMEEGTARSSLAAVDSVQGSHSTPIMLPRNVTFSVPKTLVKLAFAYGLGVWDGVSRAKRPEALRDPAVVKEIQRRIKVHLASNNMIKGSARSSAAATPVGTASSSHNEAHTSTSSRKGKSRQAKHAPVEAPEDLSEDGSGEDDPDIPQGDRGSDEAASSFSRHPPGYPQPNYDPPQYRPRYPYEMGSPPQPAPYHHAHAPHPYAQSDLRTRSYDYENDREMRVDGRLRDAERDRENYQTKNMSRPAPYDPNMGYPHFPGNHFVYGPGVGAASAGRALTGGFSSQFGHAGYRGPSPSSSLNSSFPHGPQPKTDPFYNGPRLPMMDPRHAAPSLPGPPLSLSMSRNGGASPTSEQYLQPIDHNPNGSVYNESGYRSPNPPPGRSPMGAGMSSSHDNLNNAPAENSDEAADVDGDPIVVQLNAPSVATQVNNQTSGYTRNSYIPHDSSFGPSYSFDKTFQDAEIDANSTGALVSSNPAVENNLPLDTDAFTMVMAMLGVNTLADAPAAIEANANATDYTQIAALQQLRVGIAPPPPIDSQPMYVATFGNQHLQFTARQMELLHLYKNDLCNLQYHIAHSADSSIADELFDLAMNSEAALFGTLTLTSLYKIRLRGGPGAQSEEMVEVRGFKERVSTALEQKKNTSMLDSGDAMAALHMVSAVLFDGGTSSEWDQFLDIAKAFVAQHPVVTMKSWHSSPVMEGSSSTAVAGRSAPTTMVDKKTQFIIKTVAWFDVIGSVTMRRTPFFLDTYRELFGRQGGAAMERIMGCNEKVLLAIAETAALAAWRREEEKKGTLNFMNLAKRAGEIEEILSFIGPLDNGVGFNEYSSWGMDEAKAEQERQARTVRLVSNVFRATGRLYLHTVVSQCNPDVQDIKVAVQATIEAFRALQASDFDRSLVFPITLAGCMTDIKENRAYLESRLLQLGPKGQAVGNSASCLKLMQAVWRKRDQQLTGSRVVDWIDTMNDLGWCLLLV
ncbi:hypothetical protein FRC00_014167 [Tulasnella sp. 408]|nr:hypothetical protein FRC00_014167 [Tulasnella sp. 408]